MKYLVLLSMFAASLVHSSAVSHVVVTDILTGPHYGNNVLIQVDRTSENLPYCQDSASYSYVFDGTTPSGKMVFNMVMESYSQGMEIYIVGSDTCDLYGNIEDLKSLKLQ